MRGGSASAVTKLKELAIKRPEVREQLWEWRSDASVTNAAIRGRIEANYGISLKGDWQLSGFWSWLRHMRRTDNWNARMAQFEDFMRQRNPSASVESIRDAGIAFFMTETVAEEDRAGFVEVAHLDLTKRGMETKARFEERKIKVSERKLALLEQKAAQADAAKGVLENKELSEAQRIARMREVFGMS